MDKVVRPGTVRIMDQEVSVFCRIKWDGEQLTISGVEGPKRNGDAVGSCGQLKKPAIVTFAPGWDQATLDRFFDLWKRWHLNDMRAGCEHQRAEKWDERPIDPSKPLNTYGRHFPGQKLDSWNMLAWVRPDEHPEGLLGKPCPVCGYKYGTAWCQEDVPLEVIEWLKALPEADRVPVWV